MVWLIHINKCGLSLCCFLSALVELWESRTIALLREALVSEDTAYVFVLHYEPRMASIPELDLRYGLISAEDSIFLCWLCSPTTRERKFWRAYQTKIIIVVTQYSGNFNYLQL